MPQRIANLLSYLTANVSEYTDSLTHKVIGGAGLSSAAIHFAYLPDWANDSINWLIAIPWFSIMSFIAMALLVVERGFLVWARYRAHKRGRTL